VPRETAWIVRIRLSSASSAAERVDRRTRTPRTVTGGRHAEHACHGSDGKEGLVRALPQARATDSMVAEARADEAGADKTWFMLIYRYRLVPLLVLQLAMALM